MISEAKSFFEKDPALIDDKLFEGTNSVPAVDTEETTPSNPPALGK